MDSDEGVRNYRLLQVTIEHTVTMVTAQVSHPISSGASLLLVAQG
jgi:hypothetical protein